MSTDLLTYHVQMRTPLLWVESDEAVRVADAVIKASGARIVYRMSGFDGLCAWNKTDATWKQCLLPDPDNPDVGLVPCYSLPGAMNHLHNLDEQVIFILDHAHETAKASVLPLHELAREFAAIVNEDDFEAIGVQIVMISGLDKVPPEIARDIMRIPFLLPTAAELGTQLTHLAASIPTAVNPDETVHIVRSGQGLTAAEFDRAMLESVRVNKVVDPDYVNRFKVDVIKRGGLVEVRRPKFGMEAVGGLNNFRNLLDRIIWTWEHPDEAKAMDVSAVRRVLLIGVPGTGKSLACEATAKALQLDLAITGVSKALSKWVGESEANMRNSFRQVNAMAPIVMWVDEFGRDMSGSGSANDAGTTDRVHGEFLTGLQELPENVFLFAAANNVSNLPPEMLRADRFDKIMFIGFPTATERADIFKIHLGATWENFDMKALATSTNSFTGAEIKDLVKKCRFDVVPVEHRPINTEDLVLAAGHMKGRVWLNHHEICVEMYKRAKSDWDWASSGQEDQADAIIAAPRMSITAPTNPKQFSDAVHNIAAASELTV